MSKAKIGQQATEDTANQKSCRFCANMMDWEYNKDHKMANFDCLHFDPKGANDYAVWVFPEMEFSCKAFKPGNQKLTIQQQREIEQLKETMIKKEKELEALEKELTAYR